MDRLEQFIDAIEKDDTPSVKEIREDVENEIKETKDHILGLRGRLGDVLKRKFSYVTPDWEGADSYNHLVDKALRNVSAEVNKVTKSFMNNVSDICEMAERMDK